MMPMSEAEARLRRLGRRIGDLDRDFVDLRQRFGKAEQDLAVVGSSFQPLCQTTIEGDTKYGCKSPYASISGTTIQFVGHTTTINYGTFSVAGSSYSVGLYISLDDTQLDITITGSPPSRFLSTWTFNGVSFTRCAVNTGFLLVFVQDASSYACASFYCNFPLSKGGFNVVDSRYGNTTMAYIGGSTWRGDRAGTPSIHYDLDGGNGRLVITSSAFPVFPDSFSGLPGLMTCPDASGTKFDATWTSTGGTVYVAGDTIRIYEP